MDPYCDRSTTVENLFFGVGRSMSDRKSFFFFPFYFVALKIELIRRLLEIIGRCIFYSKFNSMYFVIR